MTEQKGPVEQQRAAGRESDVGAAGGSVGDRVPQVGQDPPVAAGAEGIENAAPQGAGVVPAVVVGLDVLVSVLQTERGGPQEALRPDDEGGAAADAQRLTDPFGEVARAGGRGAVEGDARPGTAVGGLQVEQSLGEPVAEPVPGDRFQSHPPMMRQFPRRPTRRSPSSAVRRLARDPQPRPLDVTMDPRRSAMVTVPVPRLTWGDRRVGAETGGS
ncbi:hypothetical protein STENM327S_05147 [Streptomyces tendae]